MLTMKGNHWNAGGLNLFRQTLGCALGALLLVSVLAACSGDGDGRTEGHDPRQRMTVPVTVTRAIKKTVPIELSAIGNVQSYAKVQIKAQVEGQLTGVHFKEGQEVHKGDLLFTIDPAPFQARLQQARANLARDRARLLNAKKQVERYASVATKGYVSAEQFDQVRTDAMALEATVKADEAAVESARLELKYCTIRSPLTGFTGELKVDQGNLIKANDNDKPLVIIRQVSPIYVVFSLPEQYLAEVKQYLSRGPLQVEAVIPGGRVDPVRGRLSFVDNAVDTTTGTIQLKATFANQDKILWPGQFVNVALILTTQPDAVVLPPQAVQTGQDGQYVFVVAADSTAEYRPVVVSRSFPDEVIVAKGVRVGERVVTDGQLRLAPGAPVKVVESDRKVRGGVGQ